jgi:hypothetical protein
MVNSLLIAGHDGEPGAAGQPGSGAVTSAANPYEGGVNSAPSSCGRCPAGPPGLPGYKGKRGGRGEKGSK